MNTGRTIGLVLVIVGVALGVIGGGWLLTSTATQGAALLGAGLLLVPVALLVGFGVVMLQQGGKAARDTATAQQQRTLLDMVQTRGTVRISDAALDLNLPVDEVKALVYRLVGMQVFSGYVKWDEGVLVSAEAGQLRDLQQCRNCGAPITLAGKGVVRCQYCGTEYFLS